jgi:hypothetical protein
MSMHNLRAVNAETHSKNWTVLLSFFSSSMQICKSLTKKLKLKELNASTSIANKSKSVHFNEIDDYHDPNQSEHTGLNIKKNL